MGGSTSGPSLGTSAGFVPPASVSMSVGGAAPEPTIDPLQRKENTAGTKGKKNTWFGGGAKTDPVLAPGEENPFRAQASAPQASASQSSAPQPLQVQPGAAVEEEENPFRSESGAPFPPAAPDSLPSGWAVATAPDGSTYYYNESTRETRWDPPSARI